MQLGLLLLTKYTRTTLFLSTFRKMPSFVKQRLSLYRRVGLLNFSITKEFLFTCWWKQLCHLTWFVNSVLSLIGHHQTIGLPRFVH